MTLFFRKFARAFLALQPDEQLGVARLLKIPLQKGTTPLELTAQVLAAFSKLSLAQRRNLTKLAAAAVSSKEELPNAD